MADVEPQPSSALPTSPITIKEHHNEEGLLADEGALDEDHLLPSPPASPSLKQISVQPESPEAVVPPPPALGAPVEEESSLLDEQPPVETSTNGHQEQEEEVQAVEEEEAPAVKTNGTNGATPPATGVAKKVEAGVGGMKKVATGAVGGVKKILEGKAFGGEFEPSVPSPALLPFPFPL